MKAYRFENWHTNKIVSCTVVQKHSFGAFTGKNPDGSTFNSSLDNGGVWYSDKLTCVQDRFEGLVVQQENAEQAIKNAQDSIRSAKNLRRALQEKYPNYV